MEGRRSSGQLAAAAALSLFLLAVQLPATKSAAGGRRRVVHTAQGAMEGRMVSEAGDVAAVDAFLGVAYAAPPVGRLRFMPPASPRAWTGVNQQRDFKPVCPQVLPKNLIGNESEALKYMTPGRLAYMRRLLPYLEDQSEDCLYLNIYAPRQVHFKSPVYVFLHGESYEWNSGNPFDGSVLAAYNSAVVVTLNYRLGVLGFFRAGATAAANLGLLDQVAALLWIQENVAQFGGDPHSVTLIGHGTGANLASLLMISPVARRGLFHRAVLMSGTALAPDAVASNAELVTKQVAAQLHCPLNNDVELIACLRSKEVSVPMHSIAFGPIVDGVLIPARSLKDAMAARFGDFDLMVGVTQSEALHMFPADIVNSGLDSGEQEAILRKYLSSVYGVGAADELLARTLNEYDAYSDVTARAGSGRFRNRDVLFEVFTDAKVVAPAIMTAVLHSRANPGHTFLYKFEHVTQGGFYARDFGCVHGEDIPYLLGMPLSGGSFHLRFNYTRREKVLSEIMMNYLQNFALFGNASAVSPSINNFITNNRERFEEVAPTWPPFDEAEQKYLAFGDADVSVRSHYQPSKMALWNGRVPDLDGGPADFFPEDGVRNSDGHPAGEADSPPLNDASDSGDGVDDAAVDGNAVGDDDARAKSSAVTIRALIFIGFILLFVNVCACAGVIYQKYKVRRRERRLHEEVRVITDILVSTEQPQLAMHVANALKRPAGAAAGSESPPSEALGACCKVASSFKRRRHFSGGGGGGFERENCSVPISDPLTTTNHRPKVPPGELGPGPPSLNSRFLSLMSLPPRHQLAGGGHDPDCQDCRVEEAMETRPRLRPLRYAGAGGGSSAPPTPIIEMVPVAEYEKLYPPLQKTPLFRAPSSSLPPPLQSRKLGSLVKTSSLERGYNRTAPAAFRWTGSKTLPTWLAAANGSADFVRTSPPVPREAHLAISSQPDSPALMSKEECTCDPLLHPDQVPPSADGEEAVYGMAPAANGQRVTLSLKPSSPTPPTLSLIGDRSPPGTLTKASEQENRILSCRNWCSRYSQSFLKKTIPPQAEEEELSFSTD